jgi:hypothetical protein
MYCGVVVRCRDRVWRFRASFGVGARCCSMGDLRRPLDVVFACFHVVSTCHDTDSKRCRLFGIDEIQVNRCYARLLRNCCCSSPTLSLARVETLPTATICNAIVMRCCIAVIIVAFCCLMCVGVLCWSANASHFSFDVCPTIISVRCLSQRRFLATSMTMIVRFDAVIVHMLIRSMRNATSSESASTLSSCFFFCRLKCDGCCYSIILTSSPTQLRDTTHQTYSMTSLSYCR